MGAVVQGARMSGCWCAVVVVLPKMAGLSLPLVLSVTGAASASVWCVMCGVGWTGGNTPVFRLLITTFCVSLGRPRIRASWSRCPGSSTPPWNGLPSAVSPQRNAPRSGCCLLMSTSRVPDIGHLVCPTVLVVPMRAPRLVESLPYRLLRFDRCQIVALSAAPLGRCGCG